MSTLRVDSGLWLPYTVSVYLQATPPANYVPTDPQVDFWADPDGGWTNTGGPNHTNALAALWNTPASNQCFAAVVQNNGRPAAYTSRDGSETVSTTCSAAMPANAKGGRIRYDHATAKMRYYYTLDDRTVASPTFTELGTAGGSSVAGYTAGDLLHAPPQRTPMQVGTRGNSSSLMFGGVLYRVIWTDGGTTIADCDLRTLWTKHEHTGSAGLLWHLNDAAGATRWVMSTAATANLETRLAALEGAGASVLKAVKAADTSRDSTTAGSPADDPDLTIAVAANKLYRVEAYLMYDASTTGDLAVGFTFPAGATFDWYSGGMVSNVTATSGAIQSVSRSTGAFVNVGGAGAGTVVVAKPVGFLQTGGTAGNLTVQWSQGTADAVAPTILKARSRLVLTPM